MHNEIYVDILISVNLIVNYFLLLSTAKLIPIEAGRIRLVIGAMAGALCSLIIFLPKMSFATLLISKIVCCVLIIPVSFRLKSFRYFVRTLMIFLTVNIIYAGAMISISSLIPTNNMVINNAIVYFDISPILLVISTSFAYLVIAFINNLLTKKLPTECQYEFYLSLSGRSGVFTGFVDTGNQLSELFSNDSVIICNYKSARRVLPDEVNLLFETQTDPLVILQKLESHKSFNRFRIIPYSTIGENKFIIAFKPDEFYIHIDNSPMHSDSVYIAITHQNIFDGRYDALINPNVVSQIDKFTHV